MSTLTHVRHLIKSPTRQGVWLINGLTHCSFKRCTYTLCNFRSMTSRATYYQMMRWCVYYKFSSKTNTTSNCHNPLSTVVCLCQERLPKLWEQITYNMVWSVTSLWQQFLILSGWFAVGVCVWLTSPSTQTHLTRVAYGMAHQAQTRPFCEDFDDHISLYRACHLLASSGYVILQIPSRGHKLQLIQYKIEI